MQQIVFFFNFYFIFYFLFFIFFEILPIFSPSCFFFFKLINLFILAVLGLRFCARACFSCGERGPLFIAVRGPLTIMASLVAEHSLQTRRLSNCGSRAQLLRGMWDLPRPGLEPVSPALAGRLSTTAPPRKPQQIVFCNLSLCPSLFEFFCNGHLEEVIFVEGRGIGGL